MAINYEVKAPNTKRTIVTATIANGASVSGAIDMTYTSMLGFILPSAWTTAGVSIEVSADGTNWATGGILDGSALAVSVWPTGTASGAYAVNLAAMVPWRYARIRSGTFSVPVNQGADRLITVILRPLA